MATPTIQELAQEWIRLDRNPKTRAEIENLVNENNFDELEKRLRNRIAFGTAGLRSSMQAGFAHMNDLTVVQATQGLCKYVLKTVPNAAERGVVIGHDHRYNSDMFAKLTAGVFLSQGVKVYFYRKLVHTPLVPFGVKTLNASCGIMITASHNPKDDNGYKVYWENACQIIPPHDKGIAQTIEENLELWGWNSELVDQSDLCIDPTEEMTSKYLDALEKLSQNKSKNGESKVKFVYSAMHGVGGEISCKAFERFGFKPFEVVKEQFVPNPDFPTVKFPNPEENGALDLAVKTASECGATLVLANDPDADRLACSQRLADGSWYTFTGNELGTILASKVLADRKASGKFNNKCAMLASAVSSKMLQAMGDAEGFYFEETLTGFKWLGNRAISLEPEGYDTMFAFEEAIGFMVEDVVRDKDGVSALVVFAELAAQLASEGKTVYDHLQELYKKYGFFVSNNSYYICRSKPTIDAIFNKIRFGGNPVAANNDYGYELAYPTHFNGVKVTYIRDLTIGYDTSRDDKKPVLPVSASSHMITFKLENSLVITLRTSGTEPKIKWYSEMTGPDRDQVRKELDALVKVITDDLLEPSVNNLEART
ncbi:hypothetical protein K493DRAFT_319967 [Basidiobolus meristosporus CBS 931.73]|uniref:Phosphoglucomutase-2 n=1 Tax=Basidiobolus meristosporus CBS 931.73 TaxID=1314790 RepID=A0A1Y1XJA3_9FUNG|nr:hypothetical protein K493DRAFT_319967 [Basidiobolus meristosporus CBS 931.73]|eukprot:ORX85444.1 hypothetical protein K493DRAFT_319967 [Basidiobolus meristosporus CBS 931.73]